MIVRTEAIVLRAIEYGETSQIVSLYTRARGLVSVMARGSRRPKSRFGSTLQPMSHLEVVYYHRETRELQTLAEAAHVRRLRFLHDDLTKLSVGFRMVELVHALSEPADAQPVLFTALVQSLMYLDGTTDRPENVLPHFQLRLASVLGFAPMIDREALEGIGETGGTLDLATGRSSDTRAGEAGPHASRRVLRAFSVLARADLQTAVRMRLEEHEYEEVLALVDAYLQHHVAGRYPQRTQRVGRQMGVPRSRN